MKVGKNLAEIVDYGITKTKLGSAQVFIRLSFEDNSESTWYGVAFKKDGETNDIMLQQLAYCGFDLSANKIEDLAAGMESGLLVTDERLDVYCRMEVAPNGENVLRISSLGSIGPSRVDGEQLKSLLTDEQSKKLKDAASKFKPRAKKPAPKPSEDIPF
jgi:hypothetical protein